MSLRTVDESVRSAREEDLGKYFSWISCVCLKTLYKET